MKQGCWVFIPKDKVRSFIGKPVHIIDAKYGCVWILKDVRNDRAILQTPKTKKKHNVHISKLCYTNKHKPTPTSRKESKMKVPKFISMSATQVPDEDIVITAMDNEGNIWQGWSRRKQHAYAITYELESTLGEPRESTASQVCYDSVMHWERILLPGEDSSKAMEVDIVTKKHTPPIAYIPAANYGGYRTISVVKKED